MGRVIASKLEGLRRFPTLGRVASRSEYFAYDCIASWKALRSGNDLSFYGREIDFSKVSSVGFEAHAASHHDDAVFADDDAGDPALFRKSWGASDFEDAACGEQVHF